MFLILLFLLLSGAHDERVMLWDANTKLTWNDFKDTLVADTHRAALTNSGVKMIPHHSDDGQFTADVLCEMFPATSWVDSTHKNDRILSHEQYHFNITECWARKLRKDLSAARFTAKTMNAKMKDMYKEAMAGCREMQNLYDTDTKHSIVKEEQLKWEKKIDALLKSLEKYSASSVKLIVK